MSVVKYFKYYVNYDSFCIYMALVLLYIITCVLSGIDLHLMDFTSWSVKIFMGFIFFPN